MKLLKIAGIVQAALTVGVLGFVLLRGNKAPHGPAKGEHAIATDARPAPGASEKEHAEGTEKHVALTPAEGAAQTHAAIHAGEPTADPEYEQAPAMAGDGRTIANTLLEGNARFLSGNRTPVDLSGQRALSAHGQRPGAMVLGCADSRVPPEIVFDRGIGELFVVRSAGNIAEPVAIGSLEYAAEHLHARVLLVLGHDKCGAVQAAISNAKMPTANLQAIVSNILPGIKGLKSWTDGDSLIRMAVETNVHNQTDKVLKASPILRKLAAEGELTVLKAVYDVDSGQVRPLP